MEPKADNLLVHHFLEESARLLPDKCALVHGDVRSDYAHVNRAANRLAAWLRNQGLDRGERVVLLMENCTEYLIAYYGILKAGGVVASLNPDLKPDSLAPLLTETTPHILITSAKCERALKTLDFSLLSIRTLVIAASKLSWNSTAPCVVPFEEIVAAGDDGNPDLAIDASSLASIVFTSGSTGKPKGVMLSHRNIVANTRSIIQYLELTSDDVQMVVLPFFYAMGKSLLNTHVAAGGTIVVNNRFAYPAEMFRQMVNERVTGFSGVPSTYAYLLHRSPLRAFRDQLEALRYCSQAGGHMARHTKEELLKVLPDHTRLFVMYGATEATARLTYVEPERLRDKIDSIGIPIPSVTIRVLDANGDELPPGTTGELSASGPNIMLGYWNDPEGTAQVLKHNGYLTGDTGYRDHDGYLYVVGRKDHQLKVSGHRVDPQEIEDALVATGLVIEVAVIGVADALAGQRLVALAVPIDADTTEQEILRRCLKVLPRHKLPSEVCFVKMLPKQGSGKIVRATCVELYQNLCHN